jgi:tRNA-specific 2-thiouridylase
VEDARAVAFRLGMDYTVFNLSRAFRREVMAPFAEAYRRGLTPNPCIECNRTMKFAELLRRAEELGAARLVTGHYARVVREGDRWLLKKARDASKDQSYVLYTLTQRQLEKVRFPLGELTKDEVRAIAAENGFLNAGKPDSQDICFVPDGDYASVVERFSGTVSVPGNFVTEDGRVLGRHKGIIHYTIGQRKGLGLSLPAPLYVVRIDPEKNEVVLGPQEALFGSRVTVKNMNWISGKAPEEPITVQAKLRYRQPPAEALACPQADGSFLLEFTVPQRAVTPGQTAALYDGEEVLGGGTIE